METERDNQSIDNYRIAQLQTPISSPLQTVHTPPTPPRPNPPRVMVSRFAPLVLPQVLDDMPADYQSKLPFFDGTPNSIIAQQQVDRMVDFYELH